MTAAPRPDPRSFRERLHAREPMLGTFVKTPGAHTTEIIGGLGYDFVVLDGRAQSQPAMNGRLAAALADRRLEVARP
mgnify:CR=1 FL=1